MSLTFPDLPTKDESAMLNPIGSIVTE